MHDDLMFACLFVNDRDYGRVVTMERNVRVPEFVLKHVYQDVDRVQFQYCDILFLPVYGPLLLYPM